MAELLDRDRQSRHRPAHGWLVRAGSPGRPGSCGNATGHDHWAGLWNCLRPDRPGLAGDDRPRGVRRHRGRAHLLEARGGGGASVVQVAREPREISGAAYALTMPSRELVVQLPVELEL